MPDPWEYPWYASWDLAFHCVALAHLDADFAKRQLILLCREWYMHPNGQLPAYEWNFSDVNPPVQAWAALRVFQIDPPPGRRGEDATPDYDFLERVFHKLMLNFTWWVNRKDAEGNNVFEGGFLGLDNIGLFDRSKPLPVPGHLEQSDGTAWMAMYSLNLLEMALILARRDPVYEDVATKFFEHFTYIASAMSSQGLWDDDDGFFYDVITFADGTRQPVRVLSMVGVVALFAVTVLEQTDLEASRTSPAAWTGSCANKPDYARHLARLHEPGASRPPAAVDRRRRPAAPDARPLPRPRGAALGPRAALPVARLRDQPVHPAHRRSRRPHRLRAGRVHQLPLRRQLQLAGPGLVSPQLPAHRVPRPLRRLLRGSTSPSSTRRDRATRRPGRGRRRPGPPPDVDLPPRRDGRRPVFGGTQRLQTDPAWRDQLWFHEYFHGDTGAGLGASHQTGWTGLVLDLIADRRLGGRH